MITDCKFEKCKGISISKDVYINLLEIKQFTIFRYITTSFLCFAVKNTGITENK